MPRDKFYHNVRRIICLPEKQAVSIQQGGHMQIDTFFRVRETKEELQKLDDAIHRLGYKDRADWYRDMKRKTIREAEERKAGAK